MVRDEEEGRRLIDVKRERERAGSEKAEMGEIVQIYLYIPHNALQTRAAGPCDAYSNAVTRARERQGRTGAVLAVSVVLDSNVVCKFVELQE